jgi:hypothetical protein
METELSADAYISPSASMPGSVSGGQQLDGAADAKQHLDTLLSGIRGVVEARMERACDDIVEPKLSLILRKLYVFTVPDHYERKLALHTASCLLEISSTHGIIAAAGQHEQVMQVYFSPRMASLTCN